jgi:hypothetical protein
MRVFLTIVYEMSIAALQCKTMWQPVNSVDQPDNGCIDDIIAETGQTFPPLILIMRIVC